MKTLIGIVGEIVVTLLCGYACTVAISSAIKLNVMFYAIMSLVFFTLTILCAILVTRNVYNYNHKGD